MAVSWTITNQWLIISTPANFFLQLFLTLGSRSWSRVFLLYVQYLARCRESNPNCCDRSQVCSYSFTFPFIITFKPPSPSQSSLPSYVFHRYLVGMLATRATVFSSFTSHSHQCLHLLRASGSGLLPGALPRLRPTSPLNPPPSPSELPPFGAIHTFPGHSVTFWRNVVFAPQASVSSAFCCSVHMHAYCICLFCAFTFKKIKWATTSHFLLIKTGSFLSLSLKNYIFCKVHRSLLLRICFSKMLSVRLKWKIEY